jgi:hypothetical protein
VQCDLVVESLHLAAAQQQLLRTCRQLPLLLLHRRLGRRRRQQYQLPLLRRLPRPERNPLGAARREARLLRLRRLGRQRRRGRCRAGRMCHCLLECVPHGTVG